LTHAAAEVLPGIDSVLAEARATLPRTEIIFAEDKMKVQVPGKKRS